MVSKTTYQRRLSTRNGHILPADTFFSQAKKRHYHTVYSLFFIAFFHFFFLFTTHAQGDDNTRNPVTETTLLAQRGDAEAQFSLALMYDEGRLVPHDSSKAAYWLTKAARQNLPAAALYLGIKYEFGNGVQQDKATAEKWYEQAAVQGWAMAQYLLAMLLLDERSMENRINAGAWLKLAGKQEYPKAKEKYLEIEQTLTEQQRTLLIKRFEQYAGRVKSSSSGTH